MADPIPLLDKSSDGDEHIGGVAEKRTLFARRWYILFVLSLIACVQGWVWNTYGPIAITTLNSTVFNWNDAIVAWMALWGPVGYFIAFAPTAWMLDVLQMRPTAITAAALVLAGCLVRMISTDNVPLHNGTNVTLTMVVQHVGQMLNGLAGPFSMSAGTVLSAAWFAPKERTISTAIFCTANQVGVTISYIAGPQLVPVHGTVDDVRFYLWVCVGAAALTFVLAVAYLPSKPPAGFEPSSSAAVERIPIREGVGLLLHNRNFWLVTIAYAFCTGFYAGWGPLYALIVNWLGPSIAPDPQKTASWIGFWSNIAANLAGMLFAWILDRGLGRKRLKALLIVISALGALSYAVFAVLIAEKSWLQVAGLPTVYILCILSACFVMGTVPMYYELAVDTVYPVAEGLTTTVLTVTNNLGAFIFMLLPIVGVGIGDWVNYSVGGACILSIIMMLIFRGRLKRFDEDNAQHAQRNGSGTVDGSKRQTIDSAEDSTGDGSIFRGRMTSADCYATTGATEQDV